jgi:glycosyltransferase involved in cell wall biosynthesis
VGVVGRLHYKKRPQLAIDAFRKYADDIDPTARLVFIGAGELRDALADPDMEAVVFQGVVPEAARTFGAFDVLLHTASAEPFGMVILEAMIAGVPVVVRSGHGPEYILGDLGFYASDDTAAGYAAALARAVAADRLELARQGLERARSIFSVDALARELERL